MIIENSPTPQTVLEFTDWHVSLGNPERAVLFPGPRPLPQADRELVEYAHQLSGAIQSAYSGTSSESFIVECGGLRFRTKHVRDDRFALRKLKKTLWTPDQLNMKEEHLGIFLDPSLKNSGGLIIVGGPPGHGKTTTVGTIIGARLANYGGYCLTVEDPPEEPLSGWHNNIGFCEQMEVKNGDFGATIAGALRCFPSKDKGMFLVSEVREKRSAAELLKIAIDGHLVFSTVHSSGPIETLQRILYLAADSIGERMARDLLASSLKICAHQRLEYDIPQVSILKGGQACTSIIRDVNSDLVGLQDLLVGMPSVTMVTDQKKKQGIFRSSVQ